MNPRERYTLPEDKERLLCRAVALEWWTIASLISIAALMYFAMGSSQAMKTAWVEDLLSLLPPIAFLVANRMRARPPDETHPYGYHRAMQLSFLIGAVAVLVVGLYVLYDGISTLVTARHPTVGHMELFGWHVWAGWVMIGALVYSAVPPVILGRLKKPIAVETHEKTLHADATMNKADWMTAGAGVLGVLGLGAGLWWADAAAAVFISLDIVKDGGQNLRRAMSDLMDRRPTEVGEDQPLDLETLIRDAVLQSCEVDTIWVRLREEGHVITGEIDFVASDPKQVAETAQCVRDQAMALDWRLHDLTASPVKQPGTSESSAESDTASRQTDSAT